MSGASATRELGAIVDRARSIFDAQACSIMVHEPERRTLEFVAMSGEGADSLIGVRFSDTAGIAGWVLATREPIFLDDVGSDRRFAEAIAETVGYVPKRLVAMPLLLDDRALGVMEILDGLARATFTGREIDQLGDFADDAARLVADAGREQ
jgi:GAF domain-containing protein